MVGEPISVGEAIITGQVNNGEDITAWIRDVCAKYSINTAADNSVTSGRGGDHPSRYHASCDGQRRHPRASLIPPPSSGPVFTDPLLRLCQTLSPLPDPAPASAGGKPSCCI